MKKPKKILLIALSLMLTIGLAACTSKKTDDSQKANKVSKEALKEVNVVLDWYPNAVHSFIYDAIKNGYYEEEGLKVNILFPSNVNDAISLTAAGKAQVGIYYPHDVIKSYASQNVPVKSIGSIVQSPLNIILSLKDKNISSPKDFVGKTMGYGGTELSEAMIKSMMLAEKVNPDSVDMVDVGFDLMSSMTTGKVDATIGCLVNHEVPQMEEEGFEVNYFPVDKYGIPNFPELVFVTSDKMLKEEKDTLVKFLTASKKGFENMKNDSDTSLKILLDNQNEENFPLSQSVEEKSMQVLLPVMETETQPFLSQNKEDWKKTIEWMKTEKIIEKDVNVDDIVVDLID